MKISRRYFMGGASALVLSKAEARFPRGFISVTPNNNRVTINAQADYLNLAKGFSFTAQNPTLVSSDGYWIGPTAPAASIVGNPSMPSTYYGTFTWSFIGQGSMQIGNNIPIVLTSGGSFLVGSPTVDTGATSHTLLSQTNPTVVFAFGWNIQSISNSTTTPGLITINTKTNFVNSGSGYTILNNTVNIAGANSNTGANGSWPITNLTASSFDLVGSTFTNAQASAAGQGIFAAGNLSITFLNSGTYGSGATQMANLIWCRTADLPAITAGQIISTTMISQLQFMANSGSSFATRAWLRFMDLSSVQANYEADFSQRTPATYVNYSASALRSGYWTPSSGGAITNNGSDAYTCSDPSVSTLSGGNYIDCAVVQGIPSATNTGGVPTLAVGSGPAKPVYNYADGIPPFILKLTAGTPSPGTDILQYTFQATWLNSNTPYVFNYQTVAGDGTLATLNANLENALSADTTLASASIFAGNPQNGVGPFIYPRCAQAGRLSITYSSGPAISVVWNMKTSAITSGSAGTFIYNYLVDGWIYKAGGMTAAIPLEAVVDMCNRAGMNCWWNFGTTKGSYITAITNFFGDATTGLTSGLRFGFECYNEVWNSGAFPYSILQTFGLALGINNSSDKANFSYTSLKTIQYGALAKTAWTGKGRNATDFYVLQQTQGANLSINGNFDAASLRGTYLNASTNTIYGTYGGLNGGTAPSYNAAPTRPVDITNAIGYAPYWNSHWLGNGSFTTSSQFKGTATQNSDLLQAAMNFANGSVSTAFTSLTNEFNGTTVKSGGSTGGIDLSGEQALMTQMEAICAQYDGAGRVTAGLPALAVNHYEGAGSFGSGSNGNTGVNSLTFNTVLTADITALANQFTTLDSPVGSFNVSPYTVSGTDNKTEMATMVLQMLQAWKFDVDNNGNAANTASYKTLIKTSYYQAFKTISGGNREAKPCQYGYAASNWGFLPSSVNDLVPYQNYNAISEWNAGG